MTYTNLAIIILAAGKGTRMCSSIPKVMHEIAGLPLVNHVANTAKQLSPQKTVVVVGPKEDLISKAVHPLPVILQEERNGTAHAVNMVKNYLDGFVGTVLVLYGADPLIKSSTLLKMLEKIKQGSSVVALGFHSDSDNQYGRLQEDKSGNLIKIVEYNESTEVQKRNSLCNGGAVAIDSGSVWNLLERVNNNNKKGEYYLTDIVEIASKEGLKCSFVQASENELVGVDTMMDLAFAEKQMQKRLRSSLMAAGVKLIDPETVWLNYDTQIEPDVVVEQNVIFGPDVKVSSNAKIRAFTYIENAVISSGAVLGPYARIRPGTVINKYAHIGNFVEVKNSNIMDNVKINHLSYVGDSTVGSKTNIGAGTITANYDGFKKYKTQIGSGVSVGSNSVLVAPVTLEDGSVVGAGSIVRDNLPKDSLYVENTRSQKRVIQNWAKDKRKKATNEES